jgi:phosphoribosylglycinamide formyltransferase-1
MQATQCSVVVLISGNGTNLQALIDACTTSHFKITGVISNKADAYGLERAQKANIPTTVVNHREFESREAFDAAVIETIDTYQPQLIVLAGFMRILSPSFVQHYSGKIINIHPSLLPKYPGINTHQRALDAGDKAHGVSIHFVNEELDGGPIIAQGKVPILTTDDAAELAKRVAIQEHIMYPKIVSWFAANRLKMEGNSALLDGEILPATGLEVSSA